MNHLEHLPPQICDLNMLECLDVSENKLMTVPDDIGNMANLYDLTLSKNCLEVQLRAFLHVKSIVFRLYRTRLAVSRDLLFSKLITIASFS